MKKLKIALLSGGRSSEREVSLKSGTQVLEALDKDKYDVVRYDPAADLPLLVADADEIDFALIILHGPFGEDGTVQGFLDLLDIPYQGSGVLGSAVAMNKLTAKRLYEKAGLPVPAYAVFEQGDPVSPQDVFERLGRPVVIKPAAAGSSIGMAIVSRDGELAGAMEHAFTFCNEVLVEAYIKGVELTGGVLGNDRPEALPLIEIVPGDSHVFFDYNAKYEAGETEEICPARVDAVITARAQQYAVVAHKALFCEGYSRTDMILQGDEIFVLETNTIPGMTRTSLFPQAAAQAGYAFPRLMDQLIELGMQAHARRKSG